MVWAHRARGALHKGNNLCWANLRRAIPSRRSGSAAGGIVMLRKRSDAANVGQAVSKPVEAAARLSTVRLPASRGALGG